MDASAQFLVFGFEVALFTTIFQEIDASEYMFKIILHIKIGIG